MDLVNLMYKYINKFIKCEELIKELENIDFSKYSKEEQEEIKNLISKIKNIKENVPNEVDETEKNRITKLNNTLEKLEEAIKNINDNSTLQMIKEKYDKLLKEKEITKDGGKLYSEIFNLMTNHHLVNKYAESMNDIELLDFIAQYIKAPLPPEIDQDAFNDLVKAGIENDKKEALWRLAFNYNYKNMDLSLIEDYYIEKRDSYYLTELVSAVYEDLDLSKLVDKVIQTKDKDFIEKLIVSGDYLKDMFSNEDKQKLKNSLK